MRNIKRTMGAVAAMLVAACSMFNREGPSVNCADLANGAANACKDGIIATCLQGQVQYEVCDSQSACDQVWQTTGLYRCLETDSLPSLSVSVVAGGGGTGGSSGAGGAVACLPVSSACTVGGAACCAGATCVEGACAAGCTLNSDCISQCCLEIIAAPGSRACAPASYCGSAGAAGSSGAGGAGGAGGASGTGGTSVTSGGSGGVIGGTGGTGGGSGGATGGTGGTGVAGCPTNRPNTGSLCTNTSLVCPYTTGNSATCSCVMVTGNSVWACVGGTGGSGGTGGTGGTGGSTGGTGGVGGTGGTGGTTVTSTCPIVLATAPAPALFTATCKNGVPTVSDGGYWFAFLKNGGAITDPPGVSAATPFLKLTNCTNYVTMSGSVPGGSTIGPAALVGFTFNASPRTSLGIQFVYQATGVVDFMVETLAGVYYVGGSTQLDTNKTLCLGTSVTGSKYAKYTLPAATTDTTLRIAWSDARLAGLVIDPAQILFVQWGQSLSTNTSVAATFSVKLKDVTLY